MDRHRLIFLGCALTLVLANVFVWYVAAQNSKATVQDQDVNSEKVSDVLVPDVLIPDESIHREDPVLQNAITKFSVYGDRFNWPYKATFTKITSENGVSEEIELLDAMGGVVAKGACGTYGHYEGPYGSQQLSNETRTFVRNNTTFVVTYGEYERERYSSGYNNPPLPLAGVPTEIIIEVASEEAVEARKGTLVWRKDACAVSTYGDAPISNQSVADLKEVYNSWY